MIHVPDVLTRTVSRTWPSEAPAWIAGLAATVGGIAVDWGLEVGRPYALSFHWVAPVRCADGTAAVLKVGVPDGHLDSETSALRAFDGRGCVRLLRDDPTRGALLLERAEPGGTAEALPDEEATAVIAALLRELHAAPLSGLVNAPFVQWGGAGLPHVRDELAEFDAHLVRYGGDSPIPRRTVERARAVYRDLCDSGPADVVLHGDLHHANVLRAERRPWLAIDPHGRVGDPGYDTGQLLYNPLGAADDLPDLAPRRVEQLADALGMPVERTRAWGFAVCVLSEVWSASDGEIDGVPLAVAHRLEADL